jgi:hypothetical protein
MSNAAEQYASMIRGIESLGITRTEIARGAQVSRTTVFRLAVGDARQPSFETISRIKAFEERIAPASVTDIKQG